MFFIFLFRLLSRMIGSFSRRVGAGPRPTYSGRVVRVIDGDTLDVRIGGQVYRVRIAYMDAPEHDQVFGAEASRHLLSMVDDRNVDLTVVAESDYYGRIVAIVQIEGFNVGLEMVYRGAAWAADYPDTPGEYRVAETDARARQDGLWAQRNAVRPSDHRRVVVG